MFKKTVALLLCLSFMLPLTACRGKTGSGVPADGKIKVTVTFNAMAEFVKAVGKDKVDVTVMVPDGVEPHEFEPKAKDLAGIDDSKVFVYNGMDMETWMDKLFVNIDKNTAIVEASKGIKPITGTGEDTKKAYEQYDPHTWLSPKCAQVELKNIKDALQKADPADKDYFNKNYEAYISQLENIYKEYSVKFKTAKTKNIVTGHAAFAYLCRDFRLKQNSVEDVFADGEPTPQKLSSLISFCKSNNVKTVFVENMVSPAVSKTLAGEVGAKVATIYTFESNEDNKSYLDRMKINLDEINKSLNN